MDGQAGNIPTWVGKDSSCRCGSISRGETGIEKACGVIQDSRLGGRLTVKFWRGSKRHRGAGEIGRVLLQFGRLPVRSGRGTSKLLRGPRNVFPSLLRTEAVTSSDGRRENERCLAQSDSRRASPGPDRKARIGALRKGREEEVREKRGSCVRQVQQIIHGMTGNLKQLATENGPTQSSSEVASCVFH
jgi:hypothetical protein